MIDDRLVALNANKREGVMSQIRISVRAGGTSIEVEEESHPLVADDVPQMLGIAVRRVCDALGGDRLNAVRKVAEEMGVHVEYVE
jgi:hypothetical protein